MKSKYDFLFKFIMIGESSVGKSCLLQRFVQGRFMNDHNPTLGVQFGSKILAVGSYSIKIQIWDTAGQQSFKAITRSYFKSSIAAFLVFDITNRETFESLNQWLFQIKNNSHNKIQGMLIGNKFDLKQDRQVTSQEALKFAQTHGLTYYQTSARSGYKVEEAFKCCAEKVVKMIQNKQFDQTETAYFRLENYGIKRGQKANEIPGLNNIGSIKTNNKGQKSQREQNKKCCGI